MTSTHNSPVTNLECQQHSILKWVMNACSGALSAPDVAKLGRHHSARQHTVSKYLTLVRFCQFMINLTEMWSFYIGNIINTNTYIYITIIFQCIWWWVKSEILLLLIVPFLFPQIHSQTNSQVHSQIHSQIILKYILKINSQNKFSNTFSNEFSKTFSNTVSNKFSNNPQIHSQNIFFNTFSN